MGKAPIVLDDRAIEQIEIMSGLGLTIDKIALVIGISPATFYRKKKLISKVQDAYEAGLAKAEHTISQTLYELAVKERNLSAIIWWEKTRFGRSDRTEVKQTTVEEQVIVYLPDNGRDIKIDPNDDDDLVLTGEAEDQ